MDDGTKKSSISTDGNKLKITINDNKNEVN